MKRAPESGSSLPSKRQKLEDGYQSTGESFFPLDLVPLVPMGMIASYLDEQDLVAFDRTAEWAHQLLSDNARWWRPRFEQLKKIDPHISIEKPADAPSDWWYVQFKAHFARIKQSQWAEINYLQERHTDLDSITHPAKNLDELIERHLLLNKLNSDLNCGHNQLQALPESIGNLPLLEELDCSYNQLQALPSQLKTRFGEEWHYETLRSQEVRAEQGAPSQEYILPLYTRARDGEDAEETPERKQNHEREFKL